MSNRVPYQDITIRETRNGPELVFDGGVSGIVIPMTEADTGKLAAVLRRRRRRRRAHHIHAADWPRHDMCPAWRSS